MRSAWPASEARGSIIFGDTTRWPDFIRAGFLPLDLAFGVAWFMLATYTLYGGMLASGKPTEDTRWSVIAKFIGGTAMFLAGICGVIGAGTYGWFFSIEFALIGAAFLVGLAVLLGGIVLLFEGAGTVLGMIWAAIKRSVVKRAERAGKSYTPGWYKKLPGFNQLSRLGDWLNANDIPDDSKEK